MSAPMYATRAALSFSEVDAVRRRAGDKYVVNHVVAAFDFRRSAARARADFADHLRAFLEVVVILHRELFVASLRGGNRVSVFEIFERIEALNRKRLRADAGDLFVDVTIKTLDQRHDAEKSRDAADH